MLPHNWKPCNESPSANNKQLISPPYLGDAIMKCSPLPGNHAMNPQAPITNT